MSNSVTVCIVGDVVGKPGRTTLVRLVPAIRQRYTVDFFIANCENIAGGSGITPATAQEVFDAGVDVITMGDHIWGNRDGYQLIEKEPRLLRPANYPEVNPGRGFCIVKVHEYNIAVVNLVGRIFMNPSDCPFRVGAHVIEKIRAVTPIVIVDIHAEATSEKIALGRYFAGKASAVVGTHTHVQTADEQIFPQGTAYMTDLGMTGAHESIIGRSIEPVLQRFVSQMPHRFTMASEDLRISGALISIDTETGRAQTIRRIQEKLA